MEVEGLILLYCGGSFCFLQVALDRKVRLLSTPKLVERKAAIDGSPLGRVFRLILQVFFVADFGGQRVYWSFWRLISRSSDLVGAAANITAVTTVEGQSCCNSPAALSSATDGMFCRCGVFQGAARLGQDKSDLDDTAHN